MGWRCLIVLGTVAAAATVSALMPEEYEKYYDVLEGIVVDDDHKDINLDRLITVCEEGRMQIYLRRDFNSIHLRGPEPECKAQWANFTEYDGNVIRVQTWTLPLVEGRSNGPCGLRFIPGNGTDLYNVTLYGPAADFKRDAQCIRTGLLDKRGAHIRIATITPSQQQRNLTAARPTVPGGGGATVPTETAPAQSEDTVDEAEMVGGTVEVLRRQTLSARFHHRLPADISLWPHRCWIVNEKRRSRRLVVDRGCPVRVGARNQTVVSVGSETQNEISGDKPHLFFNADHTLFENEDSADLPSFHIQCDVFACKGEDLFSQVIGVPRCPSMEWCERDRELTAFEPKDVFEINLPFTIAISRSAAIEQAEYRPLGMAVYPSQFWWWDHVARKKQQLLEEGKSRSVEVKEAGCPLLITGIVIVVFLLVAGLCAALCRWWSRQSERAKALATTCDSPLPLVGNEPIIILDRDWKCIREKRAALMRGWTEEESH